MQNSNVCLAGRELQTVDLELTEEQRLLQKSVREFAESEVRPLAKELDETGHFPRALFKKAAGLGLTGVAVPEAEGGAGFAMLRFDRRDSVRSELALLRSDSSVRDGRTEEKISDALRARRKNRVLRADRV